MTERRRHDEALRRTEGHLRQAQKMEAVGRLAGGVAHDLINLLTVITGRSEIRRRLLPADDPRRHPVSLIEQPAFRAADLTGQLLAFSRRQVLRPRALDLDTVGESLEGLLHRLLGEHIELVSRPSPQAVIKAAPGPLEPVIVNLAANLRDAMPQGGVLPPETADRMLADAFVRAPGGARPGAHVVLE